MIHGADADALVSELLTIFGSSTSPSARSRSTSVRVRGGEGAGSASSQTSGRGQGRAALGEALAGLPQLPEVTRAVLHSHDAAVS
jgi:hypothetical protein